MGWLITLYSLVVSLLGPETRVDKKYSSVGPSWMYPAASIALMKNLVVPMMACKRVKKKKRSRKDIFNPAMAELAHPRNDCLGIQVNGFITFDMVLKHAKSTQCLANRLDC